MITFNGRPDTGATSATAYKSGPSADRNAPPAFGAGIRPTLTSSSISLDTNVTTSVPLMVRPWLDGYEKSFQQGSILFTNIDSKAHRLSTVADLPTMNFILEAANRVYGKELVKAEMYQSCKDARKFRKHNGWNYYGVMRNDMMADSQLQKLLNVDVFGRSMIGNIFGKLKRGDHVGLCLRRVRTDRLFGGFMQPAGNLMPSQVIKTQGTDAPADSPLRKGVLQMLPTINGHCCMEMEGVECGEIEVHYPLGVVTHAVGRVPNLGQRQQSLRSQTHFTLLPRIEILMI